MRWLAIESIRPLWHSLRHHAFRYLCPQRLLKQQYRHFRSLLANDARALELLSDLDDHLTGVNPADPTHLAQVCTTIKQTVGDLVGHLIGMHPGKYAALNARLHQIGYEIAKLLPQPRWSADPPYLLPLDQALQQPLLVGGKAANLSLAGAAGAPIPRGFVITTSAFRHVIEDNRLRDRYVGLLQQLNIRDQAGLLRITGEMQELIMACTIPDDLVAQISRAVEALAPARSFAVRSSALAEDGRLSFAGQYSSELSVAADEVAAAYRLVLAGKYCPRALTYRLRHGLGDDDTAMAALVVPMLAPRVSGVVYTRDPAPSSEGTSLGIYAVAGLAAGLVDGSQTAEKYHLSRTASHIYSIEQQSSSGEMLSPAELHELKNCGLTLEKFFGYPLDLEWAIDEAGLTILQCRRLHQPKDPPPALVNATDLDRLLYRDLDCAAPGIACGQVFLARSGKDFRDIPSGSVVVTASLRPSLTQFLDRISGVIAEHGSRASHFAAVARERGVPVVIGSDIALPPGQVVTVDGAAGRIFSGCIDTIVNNYVRTANPDFPARQFTLLAARTTRLTLVDAASRDFTIANCTSLHDLVRFCHEMAVREMFSLGDTLRGGFGQARKVRTALPLAMFIVDLDQHRSLDQKEIAEESLTNAPMRAFWSGLADPRIHWQSGLHHLDWEQFDRISGGIFSLQGDILASFAVTAPNYLHLDIRFGYHFSVVDAFCSDQSSLNYLNFRFKGGGAAAEQRGYRLTFIERVLTCLGFDTSRRGDMLDASFSRVSEHETERALHHLGLLLAATRMMDMRLASDEQAIAEAEAFQLSFGLNRQ